MENALRKKTPEEEMDEWRKERRIDYLKQRTKAERENYAPYKVVFVDQFQGHWEDGYTDVGFYDTLGEAIEAADEITMTGRGTGPIEGWLGMGDAGLVYDSRGMLVWDGINEYRIKDEQKKIFRAVEFATGAHYGHFRKGTSIPYIIHPLGATKILIENMCPVEVIIAGVLHDTVEDTSITVDDIKYNFGEQVAKLVSWVSEPDKSLSWECRKRYTLERLRNAPMRVQLVSCADKLDNIRAIRQDYAKEGESFWERFNVSKELQKWYYFSLAEIFLAYAEGNAYAVLFKEYILEVETVFGKIGR